MSQTSRLVQEARQGMVQTLTPQQMLQVRLTEMPIASLERRVKDEIEENPALEEGRGTTEENTSDGFLNNEYDEGGNETETQIRLGDYSSDDDIPYYLEKRLETSYREEVPIGDSTTFLDDLEKQMVDYDLTEQQEELVYYLIGSLNDNGFLEQPISSMVDELLFKHDIETDEKELEEALHILQQFEPAGIGARNAQESMVIQIDRLLEDEDLSEERKELLHLERRILADEYELFKNRNIDKLASTFSVEKAVIKYAIDNIAKHLNPRPGRALCESPSDRVQTAIPDFIIETDGEGGIDFHLNRGEVPTLHVSEQQLEIMRIYQQKGDKLSRHEKESYQYSKQKLEAAQGFINAIQQRQHTLTVTMQAIIAMQRKFFLTQDEDDLNYLVYKDVAKAAGIDISTVSRVCKGKYALVDNRMYPLTYFFKREHTNISGEELDTQLIEEAIRDIVDSEDKKKPYTDMQIKDLLTERGIKIERRTVNKYRDALAIPSAAKRKA